ncbi:hypothetical protein ACFU3J_02935 [Streptomyces sp. NPDC057411]|uniref:hypothetical protein n=1 Tax=unclassified Streptomyces TaxID=2593676 RepID=UPI00362F367A
MSSEVCGTTHHVPLEGYSRRAQAWRKATWSRVLRETAVGGLLMLVPVLLLGFFLSWWAGIAVLWATATAAGLASLFFCLKGHSFDCSAKKGIVLALGWWERI